MAQGRSSSAVADSPETLPPDFFDKKQGKAEAPDTLPADFFQNKNAAPEAGSLEDYLSKPFDTASPTREPREELPSATPRLKAATGNKSIQPITQFEKDRGRGISTEGLGSSFWDTLKSMVPPDPTGGHPIFSKEAWLGEGPSFQPEKSGIAQIGREAAHEFKRSRAAGSGPLAAAGSAAVVGAGPLVGVSNQEQEELAERGEGGTILGKSLAPAAAAAAPLAVHPAIGAIGKVVPRAGDVALALRTEEGALKPLVHKGAAAVGGMTGAAAGHTVGAPTEGAVLGYTLGPAVADKIIPKLPTDIPVKPGTTSGIFPSIDEFYSTKAEDLAKRGKEQAAIDKTAQREQTVQEKALAKEGKAVPLSQGPYYNQHVEALKAQAEAAKPKIISPTEGEPRRTGNEGRPATWTNEYILDEARKGNRDAITQAVLRGLPLPENARYVMGDPDASRAILNPREVTRFTPEGEPIRNKANAQTAEPTARIPIISRNPRPIPQLTPLDPTRVLPFPGPMPETEAAAAVAGGKPQAVEPAPAVKAAAPAPTLLEPIPPMGIKPLQNVKPIMPGVEEAPAKVKPLEPLNAPKEEPKPAVEEPEPEEVKIKGLTAEEPKAKKIKPIPVEQRYSMSQILDAEGLLASESGALLAADKPGVYFDQMESTAEGRKGGWKTGLRAGGQWRGVKSGRNMYPFMRENPDLAPSAVQKALRNKDSAAYSKLIDKAVEFNRRQESKGAYDFLNEIAGENPDAEPENIAPGADEFTPPQEPENRPEPASTTPPPIERALQDSGWEYKGRNSFGLYTIEEPGTKIRISLMERELNPEFIRRKIAEKEKQYGVPQEKEATAETGEKPEPTVTEKKVPLSWWNKLTPGRKAAEIELAKRNNQRIVPYGKK